MESEQVGIPVSIYRGGTSKGVLVRAEALPEPGPERDAVISALMGSPDPRQIDGLGGADVLTSKLCILGAPSVSRADIDFTFAQVAIETSHVSYDINCGNLTSSVALYAIREGLVPRVEPETTVRIHNTNTNSIIRVAVPVADGEPRISGLFVIDGVPGSGAEIRLDFSGTVGGATGRIFPTGGRVEALRLPQSGEVVDVSVVDIANLCAFVRARDVGMRGDEMPDEVTEATYSKLAAVKSALLERLGMPPTSFTPMMVAVSAPATPRSPDFPAAPDIVVRRIRPPHEGFPVGTMHKAYPGTAGVCTAVARNLPGTLVWEAAGSRPAFDDRVVILHPQGTFDARASVDLSDPSSPLVKTAEFSRTARHILDGTAYIRRSVIG